MVEVSRGTNVSKNRGFNDPFFNSESSKAAIERLSYVLDSGLLQLIPLNSKVTTEELKAKFPGSNLITTDFYIDGLETNGTPIYGLDKNEFPIGYRVNGENIINLDHHANTKEMARAISSGNLAISYVRKEGCAALEKTQKVVINHTDCDSIIAALILTGVIPADDIFGNAVIAADHTGEQNDISDLLQGLEEKRDIKLIAENLIALLSNQPLSLDGQKALQTRRDARVILGEFSTNPEKHQILNTKIGEIVLLKIGAAETIQADLALPFFPNALMILVEEHTSNQCNSRIRLGLKGMQLKLSLNDFDIGSINPNYGGRWNAGSDRRGGGIPAGLTIGDVGSYLLDQIESLKV